MKITAKSELMVNQKHAALMEPQHEFQALQTEEGDSLFFSIASTGAFFVTRQLRGSNTGWDKIELSASLGISNGKVKTFAAAQNPLNLRVDLAIVVAADGHDTLYTSFENQHTAAGWDQNVKWDKISFDADLASHSAIQIENVYLLSIPSSGGDSVSCFVDIRRDPTSSLNILDRYCIRLSESPHWALKRLPHDVEAGSIACCLGRREGDLVAGIYSFGKLGDDTSLLYTPEKNVRRPETAPVTSRLCVPEGATSIASSINPKGDSSLFVAAKQGLYVFAPTNQREGASPELVIPSDPIKGTNTFAEASRLQAISADSRTVVWGLRPEGDLVYASCQGGQELNQKAWSPPMRLANDVNTFTFYLNVGQTSNTIFVQTKDQKLLQNTEDHDSGEWTSCPITLPSMDEDDMLDQHTFTSHVQIERDDGLPAIKQSLELRSPRAMSVYVNNMYLKLSPDKPVKAETNATGALTVIQLTDSLAAACIQVVCEDQVCNIDPQENARKKLQGVRTGDDLSRIKIMDSKGNMTPLVPSRVSAKDRDELAKGLIRLLDIQSSLPADGSKVQPKAGVNKNKISSSGWGAICGPNCFEVYEAGLDVYSTGMLNGMEVSMGALFSFLKDTWDDATRMFVDMVDGVHRFFVWVGDRIYTAVLDTIEAVSEVIEFMFAQVKVGFKKLVAWLGFIFDWDDILLTHRVFKNMSLQYARHAIEQIDVLAEGLQAGFKSARDTIDELAKLQLPDSGKTIGEEKQKQKDSSITNSEMTSPQTNWASYHTSNGLGAASTSATLPGVDLTRLKPLFDLLEDAVKKEEEVMKEAVQQIKTEVADKFMTLSLEQVIQKTIGIVAKFVIGSAENLCLRLLELVKMVLSGVLDLLTAPIKIPILSWFYKHTITKGDDLSVLDLVCLVTAIPSTLIFKAVTNRYPFPDNRHTNALIYATNFETLIEVLSESQEQHSNLITVDGRVATEKKPTMGDMVVACLKLSSYSVNGVTAGLLIFKQTELDKSVILIRALSISLWIVGNLPGIIGTSLVTDNSWPRTLTIVLTTLSGLKCFADNILIAWLGPLEEIWGLVSPLLGSVLGMVKPVPLVASIKNPRFLTLNETFGLCSGLCSSASGALTFLTTKYIEPETRMIAVALSSTLTVASGEYTTIGAIIYLR